jgi:ceramide glucosyltransferase
MLFSWLLIGASAVGCLYLGYACLAVWRFTRRARPRTTLQPPVSVLKPLCGEDTDLYENLRSFCRQDYPAFQIIFGVREGADPAVSVVRRLIAEFPEVDLSLVIDGRQRGGNLKVANLRNMLPSARYPVLVLADSDMRVAPSYLAEVVEPLGDRANGLVTCLYRGISAGGLWSDLACFHVNHGFLPQAVVGEALGGGAGCFGATLALRQETLEAVGGFAAIADALADDHALGAAVRRIDQRLVLSPHIIDNVIHEPSLAALFRHELRWARTVRLLAPAGFAGSVVTHAVVLAVLAAGLGGLEGPALAMLAFALACRWATAALVARALRLPPSPLWLLPLRDLLSFTVFVASFFVRTVAWRDRTFRVGRDGQLTLDGDSPA